ncbi:MULTISPECIES: NADH-quinone oxidoreductase subunit J [Carboxydocella]|uniref:NADH-quinone oxidoreductase subunit J n=2 Tax=Carboxydocella TaxID=178898 RepID=A0A1T4LL31_9FIRM|nr:MULTISPECIES: NADH-quinone oxidoreductase subunit J [Carboxydocella]AVX20506.1 NADH dehydrogenase subunit J [Carboxydocella thermautotrophica]AVX30927.1 NADH dehydrogenase subunit J [Carboxydocella thermautotrophica]SJZ55267.1 NADH dehydrogenase subunit J [Carboxydocella sporoproducens DSM 16521]GAW29676.1 NADH-ubiquinone oxidoreductase [Carboxydocella sp. ULO1]GAW31432.1 NADH-ubiquinone oxidoreductase [Carboxydocella sp. JDF658]
MQALFFYLLSFITLGAALGVVLKRNLVHSALFLILTFAGVVGIYLTLNADFIAFVQLMVYVGAVAILFAFGVMLTRRGDINRSNLFNNQKWTALIVSLGVFSVLAWLLNATSWGNQAAEGPKETVGQLAELMLTDYVVPFEIAAVLLLVAMLGAIVIAKEVKNQK